MSAPVMWFVLGAVLWLAEVFSPIFVMFFFGIGAFAAALAALGGVELPGALGVFAVVSVASLLLLRRTLVRTFQGVQRAASAEVGESAQKGRLGMVTQALEPGRVGEISLGGSFWRAVSDETLPEGAPVVVLGHVPHEELTLRVQRQTERTEK